jgi:hypothetical protein
VSADPARAALDAELLGWMREEPWRVDPARFERLALALFEFQFAHCEPYARFCAARGSTPERVGSWREIPAVPTGAFKELALRSFPGERECHVFRTSGTSVRKRGVLHLDTLALYEASLLPSFRRFVLPDLERNGRARIHVLTPRPEETPDSSLSHLFGCAVRAFGDAESGFGVRGGELLFDALLAQLERAAADAVPVVLCGTAFAFVHLLDGLSGRRVRLALPPGSRAMETGGFKGRSRQLPPAALYQSIERILGIPPERVVNQYGMTELASSFYDSILCEPDRARRKLGPPWARVRVVDPETGDDAGPGAVGVVCAVDLANSGSVLALQTADLGRTLLDGFEVCGREPGAESRGCSIAADEMLAP